LTEKEYCQRLKVLWQKQPQTNIKEVSLIKFGRFFEMPEGVIVVGRNQEENQSLLKLKSPLDYYFNCPDWPSPVTVLLGSKKKDYIRRAAFLTARYSDAPFQERVLVKYGNLEQGFKKIKIKKNNE